MYFHIWENIKEKKNNPKVLPIIRIYTNMQNKLKHMGEIPLHVISGIHTVLQFLGTST